MDCYATHIPVVTAMLQRVSQLDGPILDMGCGNYSSYALSMFSRVTKRKVFTLEEKKDWIKNFEHLQTDLHKFQWVHKWEECALIDEHRWNIVLVDHAPGERRKEDIKRLTNNADYLIVHDTEEGGYQYETVLPSFKYRYDYKVVRPWTTVVSNVYNLDFLNE